MKKFTLITVLAALMTLLGSTQASAQAYIWGDATYVYPDGSRHPIKIRLEIMSSEVKWVRLASVLDSNSERCNCIETAENEEVMSHGGNPLDCEIIVPEYYKEYKIKAVGEYAFAKCAAKVTLPETVTDIEDYAFADYYYSGYGLTLPSKVRFLGKFAFYNTYFQSLSLNANLQNIGDFAFKNCRNLRELIVPKSVFFIGKAITVGCNNLERLEVESGCANYSTPAGSNVIMETKSKTIIAGCKNSLITSEAYRIGEQAFCDIALSNTTLIIPASVGVIHPHAFESSNIRQLIVRGENVTIQQSAFYTCRELKRIDLYGGSVKIEKYAFVWASKLKELYCWSHKPDVQPLMDQFGYAAYEVGGSAVIYAKYPDEFDDKFDHWPDDNIWHYWFSSDIRDISEVQDKVINEIHITDYTMPVATESADYTATSLTEHATVSKVSYAKWDGTSWPSAEPTTYSLNERYNIGFTITLDEGYIFGDSPKLYVDGRETMRITTGATDNERRFAITDYTVPAPPGGMPITMVYAKVAEPVAGQPLSTTVTSPVGRDAKYYDWVIDSVFWGHAADASLESYDPTKAYTLGVLFRAKENYCFAADLKATLNDKEASVLRTTSALGTPLVWLLVPYGKEEPAEPDTIMISNINIQLPDLVEGEMPPQELTSPTTAEMEMFDYELYRVTWSPDEVPYDKTQEFEVRVRLKAKGDNTFFAPDANITVNGQKATLYGSPAGYYTSNDNKQCNVILVYEPGSNRKRGDVTGDGNVNSADVVAVYNYIIKGEASGFTKDRADVDGDGNINSADVVAIYNIIINGDDDTPTTSPPAPTPTTRT